MTKVTITSGQAIVMPGGVPHMVRTVQSSVARGANFLWTKQLELISRTYAEEMNEEIPAYEEMHPSLPILLLKWLEENMKEPKENMEENVKTVARVLTTPGNLLRDTESSIVSFF